MNTDSEDFVFTAKRPHEKDSRNPTAGAPLNKISYSIKNSSMKCFIENRQICWTGGCNEWSDEGVSILDSDCIIKGEDAVSENTHSLSDKDCHLIYTKRNDDESGKRKHTRGRIVWRFPEKLTGTATVTWALNNPFFPTQDETNADEQYNDLKKTIGEEGKGSEAYEFMDVLVNANDEIVNNSNNGQNTKKKIVRVKSGANINETIYGKIAFLNDELGNYKTKIPETIKENASHNAVIELLNSIYNKFVQLGTARNELSNSMKNDKFENMDDYDDYCASNSGKACVQQYSRIKAEIGLPNDSSNAKDTLYARFNYQKTLLFESAEDILTDAKLKEIKSYYDDVCVLLNELADAEAELAYAKSELKNIENEYVNSMLGYYEDVQTSNDANASTEKKYFNYRKELSNYSPQTISNSGYIRAIRIGNTFSVNGDDTGVEVINEPTLKKNLEIFKIESTDEIANNNHIGTFKNINCDGSGNLGYITLSTDNITTSINAAVTTEQKRLRKITPLVVNGGENVIDENEKSEYWDLSEDADVDGMLALPNITGENSKSSNVLSEINMNNKDMIAILQSERYLNGQRFYTVYFDQSGEFEIKCSLDDEDISNTERFIITSEAYDEDSKVRNITITDSLPKPRGSLLPTRLQNGA